MIKLYGQKSRHIYDELIADALPADMTNLVYVEVFGGTFAVKGFLKSKPKKSVYNDTTKYDFDINADVIEHMDFEKVIKKYDNKNTIFYLDPPYYGKEEVYGGTKNDMEFHKRLNNVLLNIKGRFVLSYKMRPFIYMLYKNKEQFKITKYTGSNPYCKDEIVITKNN